MENDGTQVSPEVLELAVVEWPNLSISLSEDSWLYTNQGTTKTHTAISGRPFLFSAAAAAEASFLLE